MVYEAGLENYRTGPEAGKMGDALRLLKFGWRDLDLACHLGKVREPCGLLDNV